MGFLFRYNCTYRRPNSLLLHKEHGSDTESRPFISTCGFEGITRGAPISVHHDSHMALNEGVGEVNLALRFLVGSSQGSGVEVSNVYMDMLLSSVGVDIDGIDSVGLSPGNFESSGKG
jgi:hypothetical protein